MAGKINIILAGKRRLFLEGLKEKIETDKLIKVKIIVNSGKELVEQVRKMFPDVVIIDQLLFSDIVYSVYMDILKKFNPWVKMILLTDRNSLIHLKLYLKFGFRSVVLLENDFDDLISSIRQTEEGDYFFCQEVMKILIEDYIHPRIIKDKNYNQHIHLMQNKIT